MLRGHFNAVVDDGVSTVEKHRHRRPLRSPSVCEFIVFGIIDVKPGDAARMNKQKRYTITSADM